MFSLIPEDTDVGAFQAQLEFYRRLGPEGRVALGFRLSEQTREISKAGIQMRHPDYSREQVSQALHRLLLGDELFSAAWPGHALLDP